MALDMNVLRVGNLALRFLLELSALAGVAYWGGTTATGRVSRIGLAIALPSIVAVVWALFISPKARIPTGAFGRAFLVLIVFLLAAAAFWSRDRTALAMIYGSLALISSVLILVWPQQVPGTPAR
jgi:hypothetical protein